MVLVIMSFAMCYIVIISEQSHSLCHFSYVQIMMICAQNLSSYVLLYSHSLFVVSKGLLISFLQLYIFTGICPTNEYKSNYLDQD